MAARMATEKLLGDLKYKLPKKLCASTCSLVREQIKRVLVASERFVICLLNQILNYIILSPLN